LSKGCSMDSFQNDMENPSMSKLDPNLNKYFISLREDLKGVKNLEEKIDRIRQFKKEKTSPLVEKCLLGKFKLSSIMEELTQLAEGIVINTLYLAQEEVHKIYGFPRYKDNDGNYLQGEMALIGMGKLGAKELHFGSDLDLIFIFNRNGETQGGKNVTNKEFFSKLTQRLISFLTLYTRYGFAYKVDTELRPSGQAGALVTPLDPWLTYYHEHAQLWEKQALLKARLVHSSKDLMSSFKGLFHQLIFLKPFPKNLGEEINHLRVRIENELARENSQRWHIKKGYGGLLDIEFSIQFLQLKLGKVFEDLVVPNSLLAFEKMGKRKVLPEKSLSLLKKAYIFFRKLEIFLELKLDIREGFIDPKDTRLEKLAPFFGYNLAKDFIEAIREYRHQVRNTYKEILKIRD